MIDFIPQVLAATKKAASNPDLGPAGIVIAIILFAWYVVWIVQAILGYGTAYRKTKAGGDSGVALFGWMIVFCSLVPIVPGLGFYFWKKSKNEPTQSIPQYAQYQQQPGYQQGQYQQQYQQQPGQYQDPYQQNQYQQAEQYQQPAQNQDPYQQQ